MSRQCGFWVYLFVFLQLHGWVLAVQAGKPIPTGQEAFTQAKWNEMLYARRRAELDLYQQLTQDPAEIRKEVAAFLEEYLKTTFSKPMALTWAELESQGDRLATAGAKDPFFRSTLGSLKILNGKAKKGMELAKAAYDEIASTKYPTRIKLKACARWRPLNPQLHTDNPLFRQEDDPWYVNSLELLRWIVVLAEESADRLDEQKFVWHEIKDYIETPTIGNIHRFDLQQMIFDAFEKTEKIHPWTKNMVEGCYYNALAWKLRGSGYANTVAQEGWRGFGENLEKASACFLKAWELDRKVPHAAAHMIDVVNSGAASELTPRDWFDRAAAAQMDYQPAYDYFERHLLPQWHGNHRAMYEFGLECLKTKRFDTEVPFQLLIILARIDEQGGNTGEIWLEDEIYDNAKIVVEHLEQQLPPVQEPYLPNLSPEWALTLHGVLAAKAKKFDEARQAFDKVGMKLQRSAFGFVRSHFPLDGSRVYALTGEGRKEVEEFEKYVTESGSIEPENVQTAGKLLEKAAAAAKEPQARSYFGHWKNHLLWQEQFEQGEWVDLTFDRNFSMWHLERGTWEYEDPRSVVSGEHIMDSGFNCLICEVPFPGPLEIEFDVATLDRSYNYLSGVSIGDISDASSPQTGCFFYVCPKQNAPGISSPRAKVHHYLGMETPPTNHLRIQAWDGAYLYYIDDLEFPLRSVEKMTLGNKIELIGAKCFGPIGRTRFSNIRVRKLKAPPPPMENGGDRLAYFDKQIAEHPEEGFLYYQRGLVRMSLRQWQEAKADLSKALSLSKDIPQAHLALNMVEYSLGNFAAVVEQLEAYLKIKPEDTKAHNCLGWILAASRDEKVRNGKKAVEHARKACALTNFDMASYLDTLAAACAENGDFDEAIKWGAKAIELAYEPLKPRLRSRLELYKAQKSYHEP